MVQAAHAPIVGLGLSGIEGSAPEGNFRVLREAADKLGSALRFMLEKPAGRNESGPRSTTSAPTESGTASPACATRHS